MVDQRTDWDNGDLGKFFPSPGINTAEKCADACRANSECVQWLFRGMDVRECILMPHFRLGRHRKPDLLRATEPPKPTKGKPAAPTPREQLKERKISFTSGWIQDRIDTWRGHHKCEQVQWVPASVERVY
jgi:hypothetical protein